MRRRTALIVFVSLLALGLAGGRSPAGQPQDQLTIAFDASIAPTFLDPAETPGIGTPFVFLYALHDALIKPLPGDAVIHETQGPLTGSLFDSREY